MKSFNMLSEDQVASLPFLDGGVMVLDGTVAEYFREFFATEKAKTVTIGGLHPDPAVHKPNFGGDYLYFTTDTTARELDVASSLPSSVNDGIKRELKYVTFHGKPWLLEMISSPLNPRCSVAHLLPRPQNHAASGSGGLERQLQYENEVLRSRVVPVAPAAGAAEAAALRQQVRELSFSRDEMAREADASRALYANAVRDLDRLRAELAQLSATAAAQPSAAEVIELQRMLAAAHAHTHEADLARIEVEQLRADNANLHAQLIAAARQAGATGDAHLMYQRELEGHAASKQALTKARLQVSSLQNRLASAEAAAGAQGVELKAGSEKATRDKERMQREVQRLQAEVRDRDREVKRLQAEKRETREAMLREVKLAQQQQQEAPRKKLGGRPARTVSRGRALAAAAAVGAAAKKKENASPRRGASKGGKRAASGTAGGPGSARKDVTANVVQPLFADVTAERAEQEMEYLAERFEGKDLSLLTKSLRVLYGTPQQLEEEIKKEDAAKRAHQDEVAAARRQAEDAERSYRSGCEVIDRMKEKERSMARKFLEADREYSEEIVQMRRQVLTAQADAGALTELATLRHSVPAIFSPMESPILAGSPILVPCLPPAALAAAARRVISPAPPPLP